MNWIGNGQRDTHSVLCLHERLHNEPDPESRVLLNIGEPL